MCWVKLRHRRSSRNSKAGLLSVLLIWRLKSRRRRMDGEMADSWVEKSARLERKGGFDLGGR